MITRAITRQARVSRDLVTSALGQISAAWLVYHLYHFYSLDHELSDGFRKDSFRAYLTI